MHSKSKIEKAREIYNRVTLGQTGVYKSFTIEEIELLSSVYDKYLERSFEENLANRVNNGERVSKPNGRELELQSIMDIFLDCNKQEVYEARAMEPLLYSYLGVKSGYIGENSIPKSQENSMGIDNGYDRTLEEAISDFEDIVDINYSRESYMEREERLEDYLRGQGFDSEDIGKGW